MSADAVVLPPGFRDAKKAILVVAILGEVLQGELTSWGHWQPSFSLYSPVARPPESCSLPIRRRLILWMECPVSVSTTDNCHPIHEFGADSEACSSFGLFQHHLPP
jgi:hypothetical protein